VSSHKAYVLSFAVLLQAHNAAAYFKLGYYKLRLWNDKVLTVPVCVAHYACTHAVVNRCMQLPPVTQWLQ